MGGEEVVGISEVTEHTPLIAVTTLVEFYVLPDLPSRYSTTRYRHRLEHYLYTSVKMQAAAIE